MPEATFVPDSKRVDPPSRPTNVEFVRGDLTSQDPAFYYQRVYCGNEGQLSGDVPAAMRPRLLQPLGVTIPGMEIVREAQVIRRADDSSDSTVARDMDTVWMRMRKEHREKFLQNEQMKADIKSKQLRTQEKDERDGVAAVRSIEFRE